MLTAVLSAVTFILVLWTIGGALTFTIAGATITIPGFLVLAAMIYAVLASGSMVFIGRRFITVSENKNQAEAEYRYVLTRLRENGESIALLGGEDEERALTRLQGGRRRDSRLRRTTRVPDQPPSCRHSLILCRRNTRRHDTSDR